MLASWQGHPPPQAYTVSPAVRELTGRRPRTFEQWVREHARCWSWTATST
ncbi:hypothetical protein [Nonomuraea sp. SYSU D8015]|nr:hypothetical protein [Nonomuraea sp. SYSU D8015]